MLLYDIIIDTVDGDSSRSWASWTRAGTHTCRECVDAGLNRRIRAYDGKELEVYDAGAGPRGMRVGESVWTGVRGTGWSEEQ